MTRTKCTLKRLLMWSVWLYKFVTVYIRIQNYFNKVSGFIYRHNFNSVSEGLFWVYYHTSLCFWHAVQLGVCGTVCFDGVVYTADFRGLLSLFAVSQLHYAEQYCLHVTQCIAIHTWQRFGGTCCLHLRSESVNSARRGGQCYLVFWLLASQSLRLAM
jgi:hypothetical protein